MDGWNFRTYLITFDFVDLLVANQIDQSQRQECNCREYKKIAPYGAPISLVQTHSRPHKELDLLLLLLYCWFMRGKAMCCVRWLVALWLHCTALLTLLSSLLLLDFLFCISNTLPHTASHSKRQKLFGVSSAIETYARILPLTHSLTHSLNPVLSLETAAVWKLLLPLENLLNCIRHLIASSREWVGMCMRVCVSVWHV